MTGAGGKVSAVTGLFDHISSGFIYRPCYYARPSSGPTGGVSLGYNAGDLFKFWLNLSDREGTREIGKISIE